MAVRSFPVGLPSGFRLQTLREQAKELHQSVEARETVALDRIKPYFNDPSTLTLQRAQLVVAREHGFTSWRKLKTFIDARNEMMDQRADAYGRLQEELTKDHHGLAERMAAAIRGRRNTRRGHRLCSFCFKSQHEVTKFIAGTGIFICDNCVVLCAGIVREEDPPSRSRLEAAPCALVVDHKMRCGFCHKPTHQVKTLVAANGANICNECVDVCEEIIAGQPRKPRAGEEHP